MLLQGTSRAHERQHHKRDVQNLATKKSKCKTKYGCKQDSKSKKIYRKNKLTTIEIDQIKAYIEQERHYMSGHTIEHSEADIADYEGQNEAVIEDHDGQNEEVLIVGIENHAAEAINASELGRDILNKYADLDYLDAKNRPPLPKLSFTKKLKALIKESNSVLEKNILGKSLNEINQLLYATGFVISGRVGRIPKQRRRRTLHAKPNWQIRIEKQVEKMRGEMSLMTEMLKEEKNSKRSRKRNGITKKYKIKTREDLKTIIEILKMKIQAKAQRLRRYAKRSKTDCLTMIVRNFIDPLVMTR